MDKRSENRLSSNDRCAIRHALATGYVTEIESLRHSAYGAIGCTALDLRDDELAEIDTFVAHEYAIRHNVR